MCIKDLYSETFDDEDGICAGGQSRTHKVIEDQCVGRVLLLQLYPGIQLFFTKIIFFVQHMYFKYRTFLEAECY